MIFKKIILTNIFSYSGKCVFNLEGRTDKKNIVLISGRNGFGKTSFLNAVKLLFTGVTKDLRREVQRQREPSYKQYVLGIGDDWWGIINRHADKTNTSCSIKIIWIEDDTEVTAQREWIIYNNKIKTERVTINFDNITFEDNEAEKFLEERLPEGYVPFFFFDGEKVQKLAEANVNQTMEYIERLLNISHINNLREALKDSIRKWEKEGALDQEAEVAIEESRSKKSILEKKLRDEEQQEEDLNYRIHQLEDEIDENSIKIESIHKFISQNDEGIIKLSITENKKRRDELRTQIMESLSEDLPLLANENFITLINNKLTELLVAGNSNDELIELLRKYLPSDVFERPPFCPFPVSPEQEEFYKKQIKIKLKSYSSTKEEKNNDIYFSINKYDASLLQKTISPYLNGNPLRAERKRVLNEIISVNRNLKKLKNDLLNTTSLSRDEKKFYQDIRNKIKNIEVEKNDLMFQLGKIDDRKNRINKDKKHVVKLIKDQENNLSITRNIRAKIEKTKIIQSLLSTYKDKKRKERRRDLEKYMNEYFDKLMSSNRLIQSIELDDNFGRHYYDKNHNPIGMGNLSSGMKQLMATALLWALKTCSEKPMPIIVDTPMARIDKNNQENLLKYYYPHVSEQVIILPTDSEMDKEKYSLIKPYVYQEYVLNNKDGDKTRPIEKSMYSEV